jgi:hypothetical protein
MEKEKNTIQDEEISLVDLFAVVIKYRKFIILGTILTILVFASFLFIVPKFKAPQKDIYNVEISVPILFEKNISDLLGFNFANDVVFKFSDLNTISDLNKENTIFEYNFNIFNQLEYDDLIQKNIKNNKYIVNLNSSKTSINVNIKTHSMENAIGFINDFINKLNNDYSQLCIPIINEKLSVINDLIDKKNNDVSFNGLLNEKMNLQILNANINSMIGKDYKTFTTKEEINSNNLSKLFVVCFGGFIIFIFIAFLLNAIKNIKCDKISNEKIKNAWNEGKKLFP